jgi:hypothetical protein
LGAIDLNEPKKKYHQWARGRDLCPRSGFVPAAIGLVDMDRNIAAVDARRWGRRHQDFVFNNVQRQDLTYAQLIECKWMPFCQ